MLTSLRDKWPSVKRDWAITGRWCPLMFGAARALHWRNQRVFRMIRKDRVTRWTFFVLGIGNCDYYHEEEFSTFYCVHWTFRIIMMETLAWLGRVTYVILLITAIKTDTSEVNAAAALANKTCLYDTRKYSVGVWIYFRHQKTDSEWIYTRFMIAKCPTTHLLNSAAVRHGLRMRY